MLFTVGEMARELGIPASTLRYYDQEGLLPFVKRSGSGMRIFTDADYETLMVIGYLKKSGLSINENNSLLSMAAQGDASIKDRLALFRGRRTAVQKQIRELQETLSLLEYKCWYYETAQKAGTENAVRTLSPENIPQEYRDVRCRLNMTHSKEQE